VRLLLIGLAIAVVVFAVTSGHVLFLPLIFVLPFAWWGSRRRSGRW
jgi:hypothetical protein